MKRQIASVSIVVCLLASLLLQTLPAFAQGWQPLSPDIDGDGLPNDMETAGWYNAAGGPFHTDPLKADSDNDGLSDGEEMVYGTDPLDPHSPGIYVRYQNSHKTKEYFRVADPAYFSMKQAGGRYLMTEAMVVRRGTTFLIGGPISASLSIASTGGMTDLNSSVSRDTYAGGWNVSVPSGGTVGVYTATVSLDAWQKQMPIYVIFELPTPSSQLSQDKINSFLYNDDPSDKRDETAVVWYVETPKLHYTRRCDAGNPPPCYDADGFYHYTKGFSEAFFTKQYQKFIFADRVMWRIQGKTNQVDAEVALSRGADDEVRVNYANFGQTGESGQPLSYQISYVVGRYFDGTGYTQVGTACHANAGVLTTFLRSAGIPARPFITDWWSSTYDTSVMLWLNNQWYGGRSYSRQENTDLYKYYPFTGGDTHWADLGGWYAEQSSHIAVTANENWNWQMVNTGHVYDDMIAPNREYEWDSIAPLEMQEKHPGLDTLATVLWKGRTWLPTGWPTAYKLPDPYPGGVISENWPIEPVPQACPSGVTDCPYSAGGLGMAAVGALARLGSQPATKTPSTQSHSNWIFMPVIVRGAAQAKMVQLGDVVNDYGIDTDGNGHFDSLVVVVEVTALQPGAYTLGGTLTGMAAGETSYGELYADNTRIYLHEGTQVVSLRFDGLAIGNAKTNGAYRVTNLWVTDLEDFDPRLGPWDKVLDAKESDYVTARYLADEFERVAASFADQYSRRGVDGDGDGRNESVAIDVTLDIAQPGTFRVEGDLYSHTGDQVGHAAWTGSEGVATLTFGLDKTSGPYTLDNLHLYDGRDKMLDSRQDNAYTFTDLDGRLVNGPVSLNVYPAQSGQVGPLGMYITPTQVFTATGVDLNGNGKYDQLRVDVEVQVSQAGQYRVDGWLEGTDGSLILYGSGPFTALGAGVQTLAMFFDGRALNGRGVQSGNYTLMAVKVLDNNSSYSVADQVQVTGLTFPYSAADYEPVTSVALIFHDDMESGTSNWSWQSPWGLSNPQLPTPTHAWKANPSGSANGVLSSTLSMNLANYAHPILRFGTTYRSTSTNNAGYVEASVGGVSWTKVATLTNATSRLETAVVDLSNWGEDSDVHLRFRASSQTGLLWYVDDVYLNAWPAVTSASFTYSPPAPLIGQGITFVADYDSITTSLPITYTWNFGDGSPVQVTSTPTVTHQFAQAANYTVGLVVDNPYDSASSSQIVHVEQMTNLSITKSDSPDPVVAGSPLTYRIVVANSGSSIAQGVTMTDVLPSGVTYTSATPSRGSCIGTSTVICSLGSMDNGASATITIVVGVQLSASQSLVNTATVDGGEFAYEPNMADNTATAATTVRHTPSDISLSNSSVAENQPSGTTVGTFSTTDLDAGDTHTYSLVSGAGSTDNGSFTIAGGLLKTAAAFNYETKSSYSTRVRTTDNTGLFYEEQFTVTVTNVNEAPTDISLSDNSVPESQPSGTDVGTFSTTDPDTGGTHTYNLVSGAGSTDNGSFTIAGGLLKTAAVFNYETKSSYSIRVRTTDNTGLFYEKQFTVAVINVNEAPTGISLNNSSVPENRPSGTTVGTFVATDPDAGDPHTYSLVVGAGSTDNGSFTVAGELLKTAAMFDYEIKNSYSIRVRMTDSGGLFYEKQFTITVTDLPVVAVNDNYSTKVNRSLAQSAPGVLANDGDVLTVTLVTSPTHGVLTLAGNGAFVYTPTVNYYGLDSFTYKATDGLVYSNIATVTITVDRYAIYLPITVRN